MHCTLYKPDTGGYLAIHDQTKKWNKLLNFSMLSCFFSFLFNETFCQRLLWLFCFLFRRYLNSRISQYISSQIGYDWIYTICIDIERGKCTRNESLQWKTNLFSMSHNWERKSFYSISNSLGFRVFKWKGIFIRSNDRKCDFVICASHPDIRIVSVCSFLSLLLINKFWKWPKIR